MRRRRHRHDDGRKDNPKARRHEGKDREEPGGKGEHLLSILRPRIRVRGGRHTSGADAADVTHCMDEWRRKGSAPSNEPVALRGGEVVFRWDGFG